MAIASDDSKCGISNAYKLYQQIYLIILPIIFRIMEHIYLSLNRLIIYLIAYDMWYVWMEEKKTLIFRCRLHRIKV